MESTLTHLECPECGRRYDHRKVQTICRDCNSPLEAKYDLAKAAKTLSLEIAAARPRGIWRWGEVLPVLNADHRLTLGEGDTPLVPAPRLGELAELGQVWIKDESGNPTGSFKARGLVMAVAKGMELGLKEFVIPTAGNAGAALAAYAARAGAVAHVYMPKDAPAANQIEVKAFGAELTLVDGLISDAGKQAAAEATKKHWFDVSTFKEPYRLEGKKTMGLELAEHFAGELPDVVLYPTGGGTGLVGMWKAFQEMQEMGWIGSKRPRMISVQAAGCAPVVRAVIEGRERTEPWLNAETEAAGLRVPAPFADRMILRAIRESGGTAVAVTETEIAEALQEAGAREGILMAPEGAATWAALKRLALDGRVGENDRVVIFNTGSGLKYI
ncbi:MAG TPA: threonine synthase [Anaerolineales bacterium]|nr:threonine synthase [Anaerolineales bacterium]